MSKKLTEEQFKKLVAERNHLLLCKDFSKEYQNVKSKMEFKCLTCETQFTTTVHSYRNAKKTGCPGCKKIVASKTHSGKIVSEQTRALIGQKASQRPGSLRNVTGEAHPRYKGGYSRDKDKRSNDDYVWINSVKKIYNKTCVVTGAKQNLACHHLEGWNICPERRFDVNNGVLLRKDLHKEFHKIYGFGNNTEVQFADYCQKFHNINWYELKKTYFF